MNKGLLSVVVLSMGTLLLTACSDDKAPEASSAMEQSKTVVEEAAEQSSEAMQETGKTVQSAAETAVEETSKAIDSAATAVSESAEEVADAAAEVVAETSTSIENAVGGGQSGEQVYNGLCVSCHATGVLEAPKLGDKADWASRVEKGRTTLYTSAINGIGMMPGKGGNAALTDAEVKAAVDYMLDQVK